MSASDHAVLELHFDVNKTLLVLDPIQGKTAEDIINESIGFLAWGTVQPGNPPVWVSKVAGLHETEPAYSGSDGPLITYSDFVVDVLYPTQSNLPGEAVSASNERNKENRKLRNKKKVTFTDPGMPGEQFRGEFDATCRALQWEDGENKGYYSVLPSFFRLLDWLNDTNRTFGLVLRTFGSDGPNVAKEISDYCSGKHPRFVGKKLLSTNGSPLLPLGKVGSMFRNGEDDAHTLLLEDSQDEIPLQTPESAVEELRSSSKAVIGYKNIREWVIDAIHGPQRSISVIRDHFGWWNAHDENEHCGKVFVIDSRDKSRLPIFLDDNLRRANSKHQNIIDIRDLAHASSCQVCAHEVENLYTMKVNPIRACLEPDYFINLIKIAELNNSKAQSGL